MNRLINGELLAQALLESKFASKIGFTLIFARRLDNAVVAYAVHKNKHYGLSTRIDLNSNISGIPVEVYLAISIAKKLDPSKVCFVFEDQKKIKKILRELSEPLGFDYVINLIDDFGLEIKATHVLNSLLMNAEDGFFLRDLCELEISLKSLDEEYRAEMYKLLGVYTERNQKYFLGSDLIAKNRDLMQFCSQNIPDLLLNEIVVYEDGDHQITVDGLEILEAEKLDITMVDSAPQFTMQNGVLVSTKNEILMGQQVDVMEGSVDL